MGSYSVCPHLFTFSLGAYRLAALCTCHIFLTPLFFFRTKHNLVVYQSSPYAIDFNFPNWYN